MRACLSPVVIPGRSVVEGKGSRASSLTMDPLPALRAPGMTRNGSPLSFPAGAKRRGRESITLSLNLDPLPGPADRRG
jgi:hypothetical protein